MRSPATLQAVAERRITRHVGRQSERELSHPDGPFLAGDSILPDWFVLPDTRVLVRRFTGKDHHGRLNSVYWSPRLLSAAAQRKLIPARYNLLLY